MKKEVRSLAKEIKEYFYQITNYNDLTTIQRNEYKISIQKTFESKGIKYNLYYDDDASYSCDYSRISFTIPDLQISDVGMIEDVNEKWSSPIQLRIDDNILIAYEPGNLDKLSELLHLKKGSDYRFQGRLVECEYYFKCKPGQKTVFHFYVVGNEIDRKNRREAKISGIFDSILGAGAGFFVGIITCIVLALIVLPIYSWSKYGLGSPKNDSPWPIFVIVVATICGAIIGYFRSTIKEFANR